MQNASSPQTAQSTPEIKLIVTDIDGTLLTSAHRLSARTEAALHAARARNVEIVLATGKTRNSALDLYDRLGFKTPGVFVQGLVLCNAEGEIYHQTTLDPAICRDVLSYAKTQGHQLSAYHGNTIFVPELNEYAERLMQFHEPQPQAVGDLSDLVDRLSLNKMHWFGTPEEIRTIKAEVEGVLAGRAQLVMPNYEILEVLPLGASKGAGVKQLLADMNIDPRHVLALGDGENDIEMLELAGVGVAMDNAMPRLKSVANHITASNDDDGVAQAIEQFVLNRRS